MQRARQEDLNQAIRYGVRDLQCNCPDSALCAVSARWVTLRVAAIAYWTASAHSCSARVQLLRPGARHDPWCCYCMQACGGSATRRASRSSTARTTWCSCSTCTWAAAPSPTRTSAGTWPTPTSSACGCEVRTQVFIQELRRRLRRTLLGEHDHSESAGRLLARGQDQP